MKALRLLFTMIFLSGLFVVPAQAKAKGGYHFLPLVTQANTGISLETQARQAFNRLAPQLLAAQKNGTIVAFEPDLSAGILKVEYAAGADAAVPAGLQGLDDINAAAALVPHTASAGPVNNLVIAPTFMMVLYSSCFSATGLGANSHIIGSLRDKSGRVVTNLSVTAKPTGGLFACFDSSGSFSELIPGYKMTFNIYDPSSTLLGTYVELVPSITFSGLNEVTSVVSGSGPKHKAFEIDWWHSNQDAGNTTLFVTKTGTTSGAGKWSTDFGSTKIRGNDEIRIFVTQDAVFTFQRYWYTPATYCMPGSGYCGLNGFPAQPARLTFVHAGVSHTYTGQFDAGGWFGTLLVDNTGGPIFLTAGDTISGSGITTYKLPNLTAVPNYATDVVNGKSPANKYVDTWAKDVTNLVRSEVWTKSNAAGYYSSDYNSLLTLQAGAPYSFEVFYTDPVSGNETDKFISVGP